MARRSKKPKVVRTPATNDASATIDPNVALFASYVEDDRRRARDAKREAREQRRRADDAKRLVDAKDAAAAELKRLRSRGGASAEDRAAAEAAYRDALAAVVEAETGTPPAWAPPPPEPPASTGPEGSTGGDDEPTARSDQDDQAAVHGEPAEDHAAS